MSEKSINTFGSSDSVLVSLSKIKVCQRTKHTYDIYSELVGSDEKDASEKEKLCFFLAQLPSEDLIDFIKTDPQANYWIGLRAFAVDVSKCLLSRLNVESDPLEVKLQKREIDEWLYNYIWQCVDVYESLWGLIQIGFSTARLVSSKIKSFNSSRELFQEILRTEYDGEFQICLKAFQEIRPKKLKKISILVRKGFREGLDEKETQELKKLSKTYYQNPYYREFITVCRSISNPLILNKLRSHESHIDGLAKLNIQAGCDPKLKIYNLSYDWHNGNLIHKTLHKDILALEEQKA